MCKKGEQHFSLYPHRPNAFLLCTLAEDKAKNVRHLFRFAYRLTMLQPSVFTLICSQEEQNQDWVYPQMRYRLRVFFLGNEPRRTAFLRWSDGIPGDGKGAYRLLKPLTPPPQSARRKKKITVVHQASCCDRCRGTILSRTNF